MPSIETTATLTDVALKLDYIYALLLLAFAVLVAVGVVYILYKVIDNFMSY